MGNQQTLADLGAVLGAEKNFQAVFEDDEIEAVMERTSVGLLEAAEAMQTCDFQPRKAILFIESQTNAALAAEKKAAEQAYKEIEQEQEKNARFSVYSLSYITKVHRLTPEELQREERGRGDKGASKEEG